MNEEVLLFETRSERIGEACPAGSQFYDADADVYYTITRVDYTDGIYRLFGVVLLIPELSL